MNPIDALQQDWHLYYDGSWMRHATRGPGQVVVSGQDLFFYEFPNDQAEVTPKKCTAKDLSYWWPRGGAFNTPSGAVYITRNATRSMRKSAHGEHYYVSWSPPTFSGASKPQLMLWMRRGPSLVDIDFAMTALRNEMTHSVAVARDIILAASEKKGQPFVLVYRGIAVGKYDEAGTFMPLYKDAPITRRAQMRLREEGLI